MKIERISWIDTAKFLAIFWIVYGHSYLLAPKFLIVYAYTFHLALFWFLSGFLFKPDKESIGRFVLKKANRLLVPYCFFHFLILMFYIVLSRFRLDEAFYLNFVINTALVLPNILTDPLWFLPALFIVSVINFVAVRLARTSEVILPVVFFSMYFFFSWRICSFTPTEGSGLRERFEWQWLNTTCSICFGYVFYFLGRRAGEKDIFNRLKTFLRTRPVIMFYSFALCLCLNILIFRTYNSISAERFSFIRELMLFTLALFGVVLWVLISGILPRVNLFAFIGANTLIVFAVHECIFEFVRRVELQCVKHGFQFAFFTQRADGLCGQFMSSFLLTIISILLCIPVIIILNKYSFTRKLIGA